VIELPLALGTPLMWIFRTVHRAAMDELENEQKNVRAELSELYQRLERGEITEDQFDEREKTLLDRLEESKRG